MARRPLPASLPAALLCLGMALGLAPVAPLPAHAQQQARDFRDPQAAPFTLWPNIAVIAAADLADDAQDRQLFADLHADKADAEQAIAALQALDSLQGHHQARAGAELGRSITTQLMAEYDRLARANPTGRRKLLFDYAGITPALLQRPLAVDEQRLQEIRAQAARITLVGYVTYTRLDGTLVQATLTLVKTNGSSQSFTVTVPAQVLGEQLARALFDYFDGTRFAPLANPLGAAQWLMPAPGHADTLVSREAAQRFCQSQGAALPTAGELQGAQALGFHAGGVALREGGVYHVQSGLYDAAAALADADRLKPNFLAGVPNAGYYCIRHPAPPTRARARK